MTQFHIESVVYTRNEAGWVETTISPNGNVGRDLRRRGNKLVALATATVGKRSGRLARSIKSTYYPVKNPYVDVGSNVGYALAVHEGTRPHIIRPNDRKTLRFKIKGKIIYVEQVVHPGTRAKKYLTRHLRRVVND